MTEQPPPPPVRADFPEDVLVRALGFLSYREWARIARVSRAWRKATESDVLWSAACEALWAGKANVDPGVVYFRARFAKDVELSVKELKFILRRRHIDIASLLEKSELYRKVEETDPFRFSTEQVPLRGKWKASFAHSLYDSTRTYLSDYDLCSMRFRFFFRQNPLYYAATAWFEIDRRTDQRRFFMDPWPMENVGQLEWVRNGQGDILIDRYPGHVLFRNKDWSFGMKNDHVIFYQCNHPGYDEDEVKVELVAQLEVGLG